MERWIGRIALVTGASSGIGAEICRYLVRSGMKVVGAARRIDKIEELSNELQQEKGSLLGVKCDLTKDDDIYSLFEVIKRTYGGIDICVNSAGLAYSTTLLDGTPEEWRRVMDVNVIALCLCTKLAVASMRERGIDDGQIVNISSVLGHRYNCSSDSHFYFTSKKSVKAITECLRQELREAKSRIRVSSISPGSVNTEFVYKMYNDFEKASKFVSSRPRLQTSDIASLVLYIISAPPHVEINDVIVRPTEQIK